MQTSDQFQTKGDAKHSRHAEGELFLLSKYVKIKDTAGDRKDTG